jgi:Family of unknown function (DUF6516)
VKKGSQEPDRTLENLLELDGSILVIDDLGHWVKFEVQRAAVSPERPQGIRYSLTLHDGHSNKRLAGFDNAHAARTSKGPGGRPERSFDHRHRDETEKPYKYENAAKLVEDFWKLVDQVLKDKS